LAIGHEHSYLPGKNPSSAHSQGGGIVQTQSHTIKEMINQLGQRRFRFRNIHSLQDYFTMESAEEGVVCVVNLDNGQYFQLSIDRPGYVLLSSLAEATYLSGLKSSQAIAAAHYNYD
jgi:hypothetical protein